MTSTDEYASNGGGPVSTNPVELQTALVALLTEGAYPDAGRPDTLAAITAQRRRYQSALSIVRHGDDQQRLGALVHAAGAVGQEVSGCTRRSVHDGPKPALYAALARLAAVTTSWLDHITPSPLDTNTDDEPAF